MQQKEKAKNTAKKPKLLDQVRAATSKRIRY